MRSSWDLVLVLHKQEGALGKQTWSRGRELDLISGQGSRNGAASKQAGRRTVLSKLAVSGEVLVSRAWGGGSCTDMAPACVPSSPAGEELCGCLCL